MFLPVLIVCFLGGCFQRVGAKPTINSSSYDEMEVGDESPVNPVEPFNHDSNKGGGGNTKLQMPFPKGVLSLCTQGVSGDYSHNQKSTRYDLDFDTSNTEREEMYAPISGVVHVHTEAETGSGFGNHICIDIGGDYYVVIAHLDEILVCDGCEVTSGQLIGIEGCTGLCTGDHVHIGLHKGDAKLPAEKGESISTTYTISDSYGEEKTLTSGQFVCGLGTGKKGDFEPVGKYYQSALPVAFGHPDGTIVKTAQDAKVYLIEDGELRWFKNEEVFWSYGYDFSNLVMISDEELECYQIGIPFSEKGLVAAFRDPIGTLWLVVGAPNQWNRYRIKVNGIGWEAVLQSWGLSYTSANPPPKVAWWDSYLSQWAEKSGKAQFRNGALLKEYSKSDVYVAAQNAAMPIKDWETYLLMGFGQRPIIEVEDNVVKSVQPFIGGCVSGTYCISSEIVETCGHPMFVAKYDPPSAKDESDLGMAGFQEDDEEDTDGQEGLEDPEVEEAEEAEEVEQQEETDGQQEEVDSPVIPSERQRVDGSPAETSVTFTVSYPNSEVRMLNVQMYNSKSDLGGWWDKSAFDSDNDVFLSFDQVPEGVCGFRLNVSEGNPAYAWLCAGNGSTASLDPSANIVIEYKGVVYTKADLITWSANDGPASGCSALLKIWNTAECNP